MNNNIHYTKSIELLHNVASSNGFLASFEDTTNYKRVWARDGVICGLAALASGDEKLIYTFKQTLQTLADNQHEMGTIPSNVLCSEDKKEVSYGGLAGRVDAVTWFMIGICQYAHHTNDPDFVASYTSHIEKCLHLMNAWEFNNKHLMYVPLSGNWADEYITDGYVLYDQLLRVWALRSYNHFAKNDMISSKIDSIIGQIEANFFPNSTSEKYHDRAYHEVKFEGYLPCSFSPSGYKTQFDAFANSLLILLGIGSKDIHTSIIDYAFDLSNSKPLGLVPAFWPPVKEGDEHWGLLKNNCKYEFRNFPNEFHNGGSWCMVNGFFGLALLSQSEKDKATQILDHIHKANAQYDFSFYENFNTQTKEPNGVSYCAWSAAAAVLIHQTLHTNHKLLV